MQRKGSESGLRHLDFLVLDILFLQIAYMFTHIIMEHEGFMYANPSCRFQAVIFLTMQLAIGIYSDNYEHVISRDRFSEFISIFTNVVEIWLLSIVFMVLANFQFRLSDVLFTALLYFNLDFVVRELNKARHVHSGLAMRKAVLITSADNLSKAMHNIQEIVADVSYDVEGVVLYGKTKDEKIEDLSIPVFSASDEGVIEELSHWWIDDVVVVMDQHDTYPKELVTDFLLMGITVHTAFSALDDVAFSKTEVQELGRYKVISNSIKFVADKLSIIKRLVDILGGLVGTLATGLIFLFVAPIIYIKSPGPIFFKQTRIGQNGKYFHMYKFRSMYMDAEKRKAELMEKNKIEGGLMFKMDDDPRIIGSEKKGKDGKPKGIGNFIRNTSLDEFPQFFNVLKGDMSLVGTRPPTVDEWKQYDPHHRVRMSAKPGITGMWQVSGRSEITDFEEVVALDQYYIEHWSLWLDLKILLKTVQVVLQHRGAS